jgi:amino acid transporter
VTLLFCIIQYVVVAVLPDAAFSDRPLAAAARQLGGTSGAALISIGALISLYGYLTAQVLHTPRLAFALGQRGDFPRFFARIHSKYRTPYIAILGFAGAVWFLAAAGSFTWNVLLSSVGRLFIYGFTCAALPVLRRNHPDANAYRLPAGNLFSGLGILFVILLASRMNRGEGIAILVTMTVALANWLWTRNWPKEKSNSNLKSQI